MSGRDATAATAPSPASAASAGARVERVEVAVVGGGPAGAATAVHLARAGLQVALVERSPSYRWRACGVFSPTALPLLHEVGLAAADIGALARPIRLLRLVAPHGASVPLTYAAARVSATAVGLDRSALDPALLELAATAGACVRRGATASAVALDYGPRSLVGIDLRDGEGRRARLETRLVIGADGIRSLVARSARVVARPRLGRRIGISYHVADDGGRWGRPSGSADPELADEARMIVFPGGYCGIAPVPGGRLNVGLVLWGDSWTGMLRQAGAARVSSDVTHRLAGRDGATVRLGEPLEAVAGAFPLAHAVSRVAGPGWLLVGDAAGFTDPFTGEGIGRALVTARLAAEAAVAWLRGDADALERYAAEVRRRYAARDRLTWLIQLFLARPALFEYAARRLASRDSLRRILDGVLAERLPAGQALDPRFLAALLRP